MRLTLLVLFVCLLGSAAVRAQSLSENLPPGTTGPEPAKALPSASPAPPAPVPFASYTVTDVNADVTADTAAHARDNAIMQAERTALSQLFTRLGVTESVDKLKDDDIAMFVQSFEVQSERVSAVRYVGVFTIHFNPVALRKKVTIPASPSASGTSTASADPIAAQSPDGSHLVVAVRTNTLQAWAQMKKRLSTIPQVTKIDTLDVSKGIIHVDLYYNGAFDDLKQAATLQGLFLRMDNMGVLELYDGSPVIR